MPTEAAVKAEQALIHVLWINAGLSCDGDSVALTAATQPSIEEIALGRSPACPRSPSTGPSSISNAGPRAGPTISSPGSSEPNAVNSTRSYSSSRARSPTRRSRTKGIGAGSVTTRRPGNRSPRASGSTGSPRRPPRWSPSARAPPTAGSMPWPVTRPAPWACPTIWAGTGRARRAYRSCACRAARSIPTTWPRP